VAPDQDRAPIIPLKHLLVRRAQRSTVRSWSTSATQQVLQRMIGARSWSGPRGPGEAAPGGAGGSDVSQVIPLEVRAAGMTVTVTP